MDFNFLSVRFLLSDYIILRVLHIVFELRYLNEKNYFITAGI